MYAEAKTTTVKNYQDFSDLLSPILVKELRQGLKTRAFVGIFILLQATMILVMGMRLLIMTSRGTIDVGFLDGIFWSVVWIPLMIMMPARGLGAVNAEVRANTLDLVQLTQLTSFKIVLGKWVALVAQTGLLVAAILPYLVLRYFFGQVDVLMDLILLAGMLQGSMVLTAAAVMLSSMSLVIRVLILAFVFPGFLLFIGGFGVAMAFGAFGGGMISGLMMMNAWLQWGVGIVLTAGVIYFFLELSAGKIAPVVENHSGRRRALILLLVLLTPLILWMNGNEPQMLVPWFYGLLPILAWSVLESLCEQTVQVPSLYRPFAMRGWWGKLLGRIFYPGWATGVIYTTLIALVLICTLYLYSSGSNLLGTLVQMKILGTGYFMLFTALILPVIIIRQFQRLKQTIAIYLLIQGLFVLLFTMVRIAADTPHSNAQSIANSLSWLAIFPMTGGITLLSHGRDSEELVKNCMILGLPVCAMIWSSMGWMIYKEFAKIRQLENESLRDHRCSKISDGVFQEVSA